MEANEPWPRYQEVPAGDIPVAELADGVEAKVICGLVGGVRGPVRDIITEPQYLDVRMAPGTTLKHGIAERQNVFAYVVDGQAHFSDTARRWTKAHQLVVFGTGQQVVVQTSFEQAVRFLLMSGRPIAEPVAWGGPIVMNTQQELRQAFAEYEAGFFLKNQKAG